MLFPERRVFVQREASKTRFKAAAGDARVLHVAAHAEVDLVDPLFSRILLAGDDAGPGNLEAREIYELDLKNVSLVTLSACESGLGRIATGDEILGFTRSFLAAGSSALIVSLWPVADESTELLDDHPVWGSRQGHGHPARDAGRPGDRAQAAELLASVLLGAVQRDRRLADEGARMSFGRARGWKLLVVVAMISASLAEAQIPRPPDAGRALKDAPQPPALPTPPPPTIQLPAPEAPAKPDAAAPPTLSFVLKDVVFKGNTVFGSDVLRGLAEDKIGQQVTLADLEEIARRVTERYQQAGYPLAQAVVPAQDVTGGVVEISVIEGKLGRIRLNRAPEAPVSDTRLAGIAANLPVGQPITQRNLERTMLLLSDIPGVRVESALEPGEEAGTTDLVIDVHAAPRVLLGADADNWGSYFTGQYRGGLYGRVNSPFGLGDNLDLRLFNSSGGGQTLWTHRLRASGGLPGDSPRHRRGSRRL